MKKCFLISIACVLLMGTKGLYVAGVICVVATIAHFLPEGQEKEKVRKPSKDYDPDFVYWNLFLKDKKR